MKNQLADVEVAVIRELSDEEKDENCIGEHCEFCGDYESECACKPFRVLSLGAGVQSSTLYLMALEGVFGDDRPDVAIFADTQWEPAAVYEHLSRLEEVGGHTIPIVRCTAGNLREAALTTKVTSTGGISRITTIPIYLRNPDGTGGMLKRQCTRDYKIRPIRRAVRALMLERGFRPRPNGVEQWIGITTDEADRMKPSGVQYVRNHYPLIELNRDREWCERWLKRRGIVAPKSACIGCPFAGDDRWRAMRDTAPDEWADAVAFDASVRSTLSQVTGEGYLHSSRVPLPLAKLTRRRTKQLDAFSNECEGMCGL